MSIGKTIRVYLVDGSPSGPMVAEVINWTGQVVVAPRSQLHELAKREQMHRTGVCMLVGQDPAGEGEQVYIGEADEVFARLKEHDKDPRKDFWTRAVAITSKDQNLTKAHGRYLESRLLELAAVADKAKLSNGTAPGPKTLPESDVADMEYFLDQVKLILPVLGLDFLRPVPTAPWSGAPQPGKASDDEAEESPLLVMEEVGALARAREIDGRFVVLKGSTARKKGVASWESYTKLRRSLQDAGKLKEISDQLLEFTEDVEFSSPSAAATCIAGGNRNGRLSWLRQDTRQTYGDWKSEQVEGAEQAKAASGA